MEYKSHRLPAGTCSIKGDAAGYPIASLPLPRLVFEEWPNGSPSRRVSAVSHVAAARARLTGGAWSRWSQKLLGRALGKSIPTVNAHIAPGVQIRLRQALAHCAILGGAYEHRECEVLAGATRPGGVFVDVGANTGWFSAMIAVHRPQSLVWAIEPMPATANELSDNMRAAELANVDILMIALGEEAGEISLISTADAAFAHICHEGVVGSVRQEMRTLDQIWQDRGMPPVHAVKVDVEGMEPQVLRGAQELLRTCCPLLLIETPQPSHRADVAATIESLGYCQVSYRGLMPWNTVFAPIRDTRN